MMQLTSAFILSRLDYCNIILVGLLKSSISTLQRIQNAAARLVLGLGPRNHIAEGLRKLHWLPIEARIRYKLCLLMLWCTLDVVYHISKTFYIHFLFPLAVPACSRQKRLK